MRQTGRILFPEGVQWEKRKLDPINPWEDGWWWGNDTYTSSTGVDVTEDNSLTYSAVYACVKVISEDLASLPLFLYRRNGNTKEKATDQDLYYLLHDAPNPEMTAMQFREALQAHLLLYGNAYAEIQKNLRGQPMALWPLNPTRMEVTRNDYDELIYEYTLTDSGQKKTFAKEDIFHVAGLGFNGLVGYSPISYHREAVGAGIAAQEWQGTNFKNGGRLQLVFTHPAPKAPGEEGRKAFTEKIRKEYGGKSGNTIGVLWEGMTPHTISMTPEDAQFLESRKYNRTEICSIFRVPPHKIMDLERATFSNIEQQSISYVIDAIRPWAVRWEQAINQRLLQGSSRFFAEHNVEGLLRGDIASRYSAYAVARNWGWISVNEIRALENMNPISEGDGYLQPLNMTELGKEPEPVASDAPITEDETKRAALVLRHLKLIKG